MLYWSKSRIFFADADFSYPSRGDIKMRRGVRFCFRITFVNVLCSSVRRVARMQLKVPETWSLDHADISRYLVFLLTPPEQKVTVAQTQLVSPKKGEPDFSENPLFFTFGICLRRWVKGKTGKINIRKIKKNQHNFWSSPSYTFMFGEDGAYSIWFWKN